MIYVDINQASEQFGEIIEQVLKGEEVVIEQDERPLVKMTAMANPVRQRQFGSARGLIHIADDFDEPLEDFKEYM